MYKTFIGIKSEDREHVLSLCSEIQQEDPTFVWRLQKPYGKLAGQYGYILSITSETKDQAHRRGTWLINNLNISNLLYWVKEE